MFATSDKGDDRALFCRHGFGRGIGRPKQTPGMHLTLRCRMRVAWFPLATQAYVENARLQSLMSLDESCKTACACVDRGLACVHAAHVGKAEKAGSHRDEPGLPDLVLLKYHLERASKHKQHQAVLSMLPHRCSAQVMVRVRLPHAALPRCMTACLCKDSCGDMQTR